MYTIDISKIFFFVLSSWIVIYLFLKLSHLRSDQKHVPDKKITKKETPLPPDKQIEIERDNLRDALKEEQEHTRTLRPKKETWTTKDREILITEMSTSHLQNTAAYIERKIDEGTQDGNLKRSTFFNNTLDSMVTKYALMKIELDNRDKETQPCCPDCGLPFCEQKTRRLHADLGCWWHRLYNMLLTVEGSTIRYEIVHRYVDIAVTTPASKFEKFEKRKNVPPLLLEGANHILSLIKNTNKDTRHRSWTESFLAPHLSIHVMDPNQPQSTASKILLDSSSQGI